MQWIKVKDLLPTSNNFNIQVIVLEKHANGLLWVADETASVNLWSSHAEFREGDIIRVYSGAVQMHKEEIVLCASLNGKIERVGDFEMVFVENPNMSRKKFALG